MQRQQNNADQCLSAAVNVADLLLGDATVQPFIDRTLQVCSLRLNQH